MMPSKPVLIYDGDCGFCRRWIQRWRQITGSRVDYLPYQAAGASFPQISEKEFQNSVQLVEPDGKIYSGAEAVYRSLATAHSHRWPLWLYSRFIVFRVISDFFYRMVAGRRVFFSRVSRFFWGDDAKISTYFISDSIFPRLIGFTYLIAFLSLGSQILGLVGSEGIYPARDFLQAVRERTDVGMLAVPTLAWLNSSDAFLTLLCAAGAVCSILTVFGILPALFLFLNWVLYLSLFGVGGPFLSFQWDILLLEAGFLTIFFAPVCLRQKNLSGGARPRWIRFFLKFLLFKLMFFSGLVKLASHDPRWENLTALQYHFQTQPLPPWTAWYAHHFPAWFLKSACLLTLVIELGVPFFIFFPRRLRHLAAAVIILFQCLIAVSGNYTFFNLLTACLCLLLLDDSVWPQKWSPLPQNRFLPGFFLYAASIMVLTANLGSWKPLEPFHLSGHYGLFAVMTTERPEIIIEGSQDGKQWLAYEFKYKPGDIHKKPAFVAPHQPRLDWQMWFAALGNWRQNRWFILFCRRLFENSPQVTGLLAKNPFAGAPPKYLRALLYEYRFATPQEKKQSGSWWRRELKGLYCPVMTSESG